MMTGTKREYSPYKERTNSKIVWLPVFLIPSSKIMEKDETTVRDLQAFDLLARKCTKC